jgi:putative ABC transport system permease protein
MTRSAINAADLPAIKNRLILLSRDHHRSKADGTPDDFMSLDSGTFLSTLTSVTSLLTLFIGAVAGVSLVVGGIGVVNIMLARVTERARDIGLHKAEGAQAGEDLLQFIVEAVAIGITGGIIGLRLAGALLEAITLSEALTAPVTVNGIAIALGFLTAVGLFVGMYPAPRSEAPPDRCSTLWVKGAARIRRLVYCFSPLP